MFNTLRPFAKTSLYIKFRPNISIIGSCKWNKRVNGRMLVKMCGQTLDRWTKEQASLLDRTLTESQPNLSVGLYLRKWSRIIKKMREKEKS